MQPLDIRWMLLHMRPTRRYINPFSFMKTVLIFIDVYAAHVCPEHIRAGICNAFLFDCLDDPRAESVYGECSKTIVHRHNSTVQVREGIHIKVVQSLPGCPYVVVRYFRCSGSLSGHFQCRVLACPASVVWGTARACSHSCLFCAGK